MELVIDTSTDWGGIAVSDKGELIAEITWHPGQDHTSELTPNIKRLMEIAEIDFTNLNAIFVAIGPGSFNGLRAGISTAKSLAFSLNIPIIGVPTLEIEAYPFAFTGLPICPIHDAGRGEIAAAIYITVNNTWKCSVDIHITTLEKLCALTKGKTIFCGEVSSDHILYLETKLPGNSLIPGWPQRLRRPCSLSELGWKQLGAGKVDDVATLQPIYLRQPSITQPKKQMLRKQRLQNNEL